MAGFKKGAGTLSTGPWTVELGRQDPLKESWNLSSVFFLSFLFKI